MSKGTIQVICGEGKGKTTAALGMGISALLKGQTVIMIQFLKGCQELASCEILERLEPELKIFRFEKSDAFFETLSEEQQKEERMNIRNGMNFARKYFRPVSVTWLFSMRCWDFWIRELSRWMR